MPNPIIPRNLSNPTLTGQITKRATGSIKRAAKQVQKRVLALFDSVPRVRKDADTGLVINHDLEDDHWFMVNQDVIYEYQLSAQILRQISDEIDLILRQAYLGTELPDPLSDWFMYADTTAAYQQGAAEAVTNLAAISDDYTRTLIDVVTTPAYLNRAALVRARVFENMKGLTESSRADLSDTLARGMQAGLNPREIAKTVRDRVGVSQSRALRIARTEILTAHRRARWDEARDAQDRLGIRTKLMHLSALLPTTRKTHANRMGNLYSIEEVEEWYTKDANSIQCRCGQVEVLVDEDGAAIDKKFQEKMQQRGDRFFKSHPDN